MLMFVLVELQLKTSTIRLTNCSYDLNYDGNTFRASGDLLQIDDLETTADLTTIGTTLTLQGVDPAYEEEIDRNGFLKAPIDVLIGYVEEGSNVVGAASFWHRGYCDTPQTVVDYDNSTITIGVETESVFGDLSRVPNIMRCSQSNHMALHNGDKFFTYVADTSLGDELWRTND